MTPDQYADAALDALLVFQLRRGESLSTIPAVLMLQIGHLIAGLYHLAVRYAFNLHDVQTIAQMVYDKQKSKEPS
jgi:hypothetical protein